MEGIKKKELGNVEKYVEEIDERKRHIEKKDRTGRKDGLKLRRGRTG